SNPRPEQPRQPGQPPRPSGEPTRAMGPQRPAQPARPVPPPEDEAGNAPTTAFARQHDPDATEKFEAQPAAEGAHGDDDERRGRGNGVSAQELLRREGRL
ncbi:MAG: hypothetical protein IRZ17_10540, partial [Mycolicibacterium hassiacum]|nr:hypothetical protein [Mycolicibacterium hassiacum]